MGLELGFSMKIELSVLGFVMRRVERHDLGRIFGDFCTEKHISQRYKIRPLLLLKLEHRPQKHTNKNTISLAALNFIEDIVQSLFIGA